MTEYHDKASWNFHRIKGLLILIPRINRGSSKLLLVVFAITETLRESSGVLIVIDLLIRLLMVVTCDVSITHSSNLERNF